MSINGEYGGGSLQPCVSSVVPACDYRCGSACKGLDAFVSNIGSEVFIQCRYCTVLYDSSSKVIKS